MVGRLGTTPLAALGSNGALFNCLFFLFFTALAVICTQCGYGRCRWLASPLLCLI